MIQYKDNLENNREIIHLTISTITKRVKIWKSSRINKKRSIIDQKRLKALLENRTKNSVEFIDAIKKIFQLECQVPHLQTKPLMSIRIF